MKKGQYNMPFSKTDGVFSTIILVAYLVNNSEC